MSDIQKVLKTLEMSEAIAERCVLTCVDCGNLNEHIYNLNQRIAELEAQQRWIPVSERLPEVDQDVLVFDQRGDITIDYLVALNREGVAYYTNSDDGAVCWMPLPESPNDTQKETFVYGKDSKSIPDEPGVNNG